MWFDAALYIFVYLCMRFANTTKSITDITDGFRKFSVLDNFLKNKFEKIIRNG